MQRYLFLGDTHGDLAFATIAIQIAREEHAEVVQLGDWGFIWPGGTQVKKLSAVLVAEGVTMRFVDGNHDEHPRLRKYVSACIATTIEPHVIYQPRGSMHEDVDGTRFLFLGGAPSIDRAYRTPGQSWWPEEIITSAEFKRARSAAPPVHVIVTHDAPAFPPGFSAKGTPGYQHDQEQSMRKVDDLIRQHRPSLHVHGHWHCHYERQHAIGTHVVGLDCNSASLEDATLLWSRANTHEESSPQ